MLALRACIGGADAQLQRAGELLGIKQERVRQIQAKEWWRSYSRRSSVCGIEKPGSPETPSLHARLWKAITISNGAAPWARNIVASKRELLRSWKSQFDRLARPQSSCRKMFLSNSLKTTGKFNDRKIDVQCPQLPCHGDESVQTVRASLEKDKKVVNFL